MKARLLAAAIAAVGIWFTGTAPAQEITRATTAPAVRSSNQEVANAVAAQLRNGHLRGYTIDISCVDGVVELSGAVANKAQQEEVVKATLAVPGVRSVVDSLTNAPLQTVRPTQALTAADPAALPAPMAGHGGPIVDPIPIGSPIGAAPYDLNPPKLPPYAWPTYAPYNNVSRVAYPNNYPYNAWPFIGPFYPFPKVPLGYRSVTLEWQDGHWWYGRNATKHDYWRVRYW